jgi:hypothetical protein
MFSETSNVLGGPSTHIQGLEVFENAKKECWGEIK